MYFCVLVNMLMLPPYSFLFSSTDRIEWLRVIMQVRNEIDTIPQNTMVNLCFKDIEVDKLKPLHIVSLACLIESIYKKGFEVRMISNAQLRSYFREDLKFDSYWGLQALHFSEAQSDDVLNLWRFDDDEKEAYAMQVHEYLKRRFFQNKDLSAVKESLIEAYYNVSDHAKADGNAFSFIKFDQRNGKLHVAVCDFGIGIAHSVRRVCRDITDDAQALCKAMEYNFTTKSHERNRGMGLGNIKDTCTEDDILGIISNRAWLFAKRENIKSGLNNNTDFDGTLMYYELSLSHFEEEDILEVFNF